VITRLSFLNAFNVFLKTLFTLAIADFLSIEEYGHYYYFIIVHQLISAFKDYGYNEYFLKERGYKRINEETLNTLEFIRCSFTYPLFILLFDFTYLENLLLVLLMFAELLQPKQLVKLQRHDKNHLILCIEILSNLMMVLSLVFLIFFEFKYPLITYLFFHIIKSLSYNCIFKTKISFKSIKIKNLFFISYGKWVFAASIIFAIINRLDKVILENYIDEFTLGGFLFITNICSMGIASTLNVIKPYINRKIALNDSFIDVYSSYVKFNVILYLFFICTVPYVLDFMFGNKWDNFYYLIKYMALIVVLNNLKIWGNFYKYNKFKLRFSIDLWSFAVFSALTIPILFTSSLTIDTLVFIHLLASVFSLIIWMKKSKYVNNNSNYNLQ
jgi:O-antigen/teichoic acid export membrane protein